MEFTNTFTVPVPADHAFDVLTDLERVAPCFPGATLEEVEGDTYRGRVKVKLGPMTLGYAGEATITERGDDKRSASITASGREKRGAGTAAADVHATLEEVGDAETSVTVTTDLKITGRPAQFGRGVMGDVGSKIIDQFATCLQGELAAGDLSVDEDSPTGDGEADGTGAPTAGDEVAITDGGADGGADEAATAATGDDVEVVDVRDELDLTDGADAHVSSGGSATTAAGGSVAATSVHASGGARKVNVEPKVEALDLADVAGGATAKRVVPLVIGAAVVLLVLRWLSGGDGGADD